jgi:hypothetical protein
MFYEEYEQIYRLLNPLRRDGRLSFQEKLALKREYIKLKRRQAELLPNNFVFKPAISEKSANEEWLEATENFNKVNRHRKIPSTQEDDNVREASEKVIEWNLYNMYLDKKKELDRIETRLSDIIIMFL